MKRAIKKGTGEIDGGDVEEIIYEGYGPSGVAIMCDIMTDNRNRNCPRSPKAFWTTTADRWGGTGCVSYMFDRKGLIIVGSKDREEQVMEVALENDAEDIQVLDDRIEITTAPEKSRTSFFCSGKLLRSPWIWLKSLAFLK